MTSGVDEGCGFDSLWYSWCCFPSTSRTSSPITPTRKSVHPALGTELIKEGECDMELVPSIDRLKDIMTVQMFHFAFSA